MLNLQHRLDIEVLVLFHPFFSSSSSSQEGKTIKSSSGFSGKGFKFDETEHALANERKKLQKAALGLQDSDDEDGALDVSKVLKHFSSLWHHVYGTKCSRKLSLSITIGVSSVLSPQLQSHNHYIHQSIPS